MRWLFIILVLANATVFGWFYYQQHVVVNNSTVSLFLQPSEGQILVLKSEDVQTAKSQANVQDLPESSSFVGVNSAQPKVVQTQVKKADDSTSKTNISKQEDVVTRCYKSSPFNEQIDARHLAAKIKKLGYQASIETVKVAVKIPTKYWVYVPNQGTKEEMKKLQTRLKQNNFDTFFITKGKLAGAISLGIYRSKKSAINLEKDVTQIRVPVSIDVIDGSTEQYSVILFTPSLPDSTMLERLQEDKQNIRWRRMQCPL